MPTNSLRLHSRISQSPLSSASSSPVPSRGYMYFLGFCCCDKYHGQKQTGEERVYFSLQVTAHYEGQSGQELQEGIWRQELKQRMEQHHKLAPMASFLKQPRLFAQGRGRTSQDGLGFLQNQQFRKHPIDMLSCQSDGDNPSAKVPSFQLCQLDN